tara:strand:- start:857 stop:2473 length:1617 start_codon:yes stop_codon:yes gene_type:complete
MGLILNEQTILRSVHNVSSSEAVAVCDLKRKSLTTIELSSNAAVAFPNLVRLDLSDNAIASIENLKYLKHLKWLNVSNNRIESNGLEPLGRCCETIRVLNVSGNRLNSLDGLENAPLSKSLLALIASDNALTEECLNAVKNCTELNSLIVSNNSIESLGHELFSLRKLGKFSASNNGMAKIGNDSFSQNTDLRELRLAKNKLMDLPSGLSKNINLRVLDCSHNQIKTFAAVQVLAKLPKLTHLSLRGNPIAILDGKAYVDNIKALCPRLRTLDGHPLDNSHPSIQDDDGNDGNDENTRKKQKDIYINNGTTTPTFGLKRATGDDDDDDDNDDDDAAKEEARPPRKKKRGKRGKKKKEEKKNDVSFLNKIVKGVDIDGGNNGSEDDVEDDGKNAKKDRDGAVNEDKKKIIVLGKELENQNPLSDKEFDEKLERDRLKQAGVVKVEEVKVHRHKNKVFGSDVFKKLGNEEKKTTWDDDDDDGDVIDEGGGGSEKGITIGKSDGEVAMMDEKHAVKKKKLTKDMTIEERKAYRKLQRKRGY